MFSTLPDFFMGIGAFILSGIDDFVVLIFLFLTTRGKAKAYLSITSGTIVALSIVVLFSYYIGNLVADYIWIMGFLLISWSIYNVLKNDSSEGKGQMHSTSLFITSAIVYLVNATDDFTFYSSYFASSSNKEVSFVLGIYFSAVITIAIAIILSAKLKKITDLNQIKTFVENKVVNKLPYVVMLIIGISLIFKQWGDY
jgi:cadmium resistance protein CadD (predicted permease)